MRTRALPTHSRTIGGQAPASPFAGARAAAAQWLSLALLLTATPTIASADWPLFGRAIVNTLSPQVHSSITTDDAGGAIVTWQDFRTLLPEIAVHHVLAAGDLDPLWPHFGRSVVGDAVAIADAVDGQAAPVIVSDGHGGAIVAWQDGRDPITETDIYATHVLADGKLDDTWPANGTPLCTADGVQDAAQIVSDGAGGAIVTWEDRRASASVVDVFAQHVLASGLVDPSWPVNGLLLSAAPGPQELPVIVADGGAGAIVAWQDDRSATTGFDVFAQHVLGTGVLDPAWPANGLGVCTTTGDQGRPTITTDRGAPTGGGAPTAGGSGAIVVWTDGRVVGTDHIFAMHVRGTGSVDPAWPVNGRQLSNAAVLESRPRAVSDGAGGAIVAWQGFTTALDIFAQHVFANGTLDPAWAGAGLPLTPAASDRREFSAELAGDGAGGAFVAWQDEDLLRAQHVFASGLFDPAYPADGLAIGGLAGDQGDPAIVETGGAPAGAIVSWTDGRDAATNSADIYAMQLLVAQTLDVPAASADGLVFASPTPNPARGPLALRFALPRASTARLAIFDVAGRPVRRLLDGVQPAGPNTIAWDLRDARGTPVPAGLYFARLEADGRALTQKITRLH